jgi:hypothetical protein
VYLCAYMGYLSDHALTLPDELSPSYRQSPPPPVVARTETRRQYEITPQLLLQSDESISSCSSIVSSSRGFESSNNERPPLRILPQPTLLYPNRFVDTQTLRHSRSIHATELSFNVPLRSPSPQSALQSTRPRIFGPEFLRFADAESDPSWMPETWLNRVDEIVSHCTLLLS